MVEMLAIEMESNSADCRDALDHAQHHLTLGEYERAVAAASKAIEFCPTDRMAYLYRASAYELLGDELRAGADYEAAHRLAE